MLYRFCPSASGCRVAATVSGRIFSGVVSHNPSWTGYWTPLPVSGGNTIIIVTLSLSHPESVYVVGIPLSESIYLLVLINLSFPLNRFQ